MSHRTKRTALWSVLLVVLVTACSDSATGPTNPSQPPPQSNPPGTVVLGPDAIVVDSTVLQLLSNLEERQTGTFRFSTIGNPVPLIEAGTIIIGAQDGGFLRRVLSRSVSGNVITLQTGPATLTEAVERGNIDLSFVVAQPTGPSGQPIGPDGNTPRSNGETQARIGQFQPRFLADGVEYAQGELSLAGKDLCKDLLFGNCPEFIDLTIEEGSIGFTPGIDAELIIEDYEIQEFRLVATGTLALDMLVKAVASQDFTAEGEIKLAELSANFAATVGTLPVTGVVTFRFMAGFTAEANLKTSFQTGATGTTVVSAGARYASSAWEGVWDASLSTAEKPTEWTAQADGNVRVYVRPELDLRFYHIVGPSIEVEPWVKAEGHIGTEQCELGVTAGINSKLSLVLEFLSKEIANWNTDFNTTPVDILTYPCPIGSVKVTTATTGSNPDTDGYTVTLDGGDPKSIDPAGTVYYTTLPVSTYSMGLDGVAENCTVAGDNPRQARVTAGDTTAVAFMIECAADTGDLEVSVTTSGSILDPNGYSLSVDGTQTMAVGTSGTVTFEGLALGEHSVSLEGVASNCTVTGASSRSATIEANTTTQVAYEVVCAANQLTVAAQTGGEPIDPDGYTVVLDGEDSKSLDVNGTVSFQPLTAGVHTVELLGVSENCSVSGQNPRNVVVVDGENAETTFIVSCGGGSLTVTTTTEGSGANLDPDGYTVVVDDTESQPIDNDGQVSFSGLATGTHSVELQGVDSPCVVLGFNPRNVEVPGEETFEVSCGDPSSSVTFLSNSNVWQILPDGNGLQELTTDGVAGRYDHVSWSPDGTRMVFTRALNCGTGQGDCNAIFTSDPDGSNAVQISSPVSGVGDWRPDWSHDGERIVFSRIDNNGGWIQTIMSVDPGGTNLITVRAGNGTTNNYSFPSWTSDGRIVYVVRELGEDKDDGYLEIMNADGSGSARLTSTPESRIYEPDYSSEGDRIVFKSRLYKTEAFFDVIVMDANGSNLTNLTNQALDVDAVEWSPDGGQIAYTVTEPSGGLWLMDADGTNRTWLANGIGAAWRTLP